MKNIGLAITIAALLCFGCDDTDQLPDGQYTNKELMNGYGTKVLFDRQDISVVSKDNTDYPHTAGFSGDTTYSKLYCLSVKWKDPKDGVVLDLITDYHTYDATLFLPNVTKLEVYINPNDRTNYYVNDYFMPEPEYKKYYADSMKQVLVGTSFGRKLEIPIDQVIVDHHHFTTNSRNSSSETHCCFVMAAAWTDPLSNEVICFKTEHIEDFNPADLIKGRKDITVYYHKNDPKQYYVDDEFIWTAKSANSLLSTITNSEASGVLITGIVLFGIASIVVIIVIVIRLRRASSSSRRRSTPKAQTKKEVVTEKSAPKFVSKIHFERPKSEKPPTDPK